MNRVEIIGRLTKDVRSESTQSGKTYLRNSIAVDRRGDGTDFFNIIAWEKSAEFIEKYFSKGSKLGISGRLQSDSYTDKSGKKVYSVSIVVEEVDFCESKETKDNLLDTKGDELPFE